jgi:hypothetical protein
MARAAAVVQRGRAALANAFRALGAAMRFVRARWPAPPRLAALVLLGVVAALGIHGVVFQTRLPGRLPHALDWSAAAAVLEGAARPGDAVALAPAWAERARAVLPPSLPVLALPRLRDDDLLGVRRLFFLSLPRAPGFSWDAELELVERAAVADAPIALGAIELARYDLAFPSIPLAFLPDRLARATVEEAGAPCAAVAAGFRCPRGALIAREVREVAGAPRPCLAVTLAPDAPVTVTFPTVRVGRVLRGRAGVLGAEGATGARLRLAVRVDGEDTGAAAVGAWAGFELDTSAHAGPQRSVSFTLAAEPGSSGGRTVCVEAATLP